MASELKGEWISYEQAKDAILHHRRDYHSLPKIMRFFFWIDIHATV